MTRMRMRRTWLLRMVGTSYRVAVLVCEAWSDAQKSANPSTHFNEVRVRFTTYIERMRLGAREVGLIMTPIVKTNTAWHGSCALNTRRRFVGSIVALRSTPTRNLRGFHISLRNLVVASTRCLLRRLPATSRHHRRMISF